MHFGVGGGLGALSPNGPTKCVRLEYQGCGRTASINVKRP